MKGRTVPISEAVDAGFKPGSAVERRLKRFEHDFDLKSFLSNTDFLKLSEKDIQVTKTLGQGSFSTVYEVYLLNQKTRQFDYNNVYALKRLKPQVITGNVDKSASADLALETKLMSELNHENIVRLRGTKSGDMISALIQGEFFIVMDVLVETLDTRFEDWEKKRSIFRPSGDYATRLNDIAKGVSSGMEYLHGKKIIFRDLKPANIGFDSHDRIKLFDFGLARPINQLGEEEPRSRRPPGGGLHLTGGAGTPRYMAPEVALRQSYGFPADVYSFSILLYQLVTNRVPFGNITDPFEFNDKVVHDGHRPSLRHVSSPKIKTLLDRSWSPHAHLRPSFTTIRETIEDVIAEVGIKHPKRRGRSSSAGGEKHGSRPARNRGSSAIIMAESEGGRMAGGSMYFRRRKPSTNYNQMDDSEEAGRKG